MPEWLTESIILQTLITSGVVLAAIGPVYLKTRYDTKKDRAAQRAARTAQEKVNTDLAEVLSSVASDAREAREQVKNSHDTNLREEGDVRHEEILATLKNVIRDMQGVRDDNQATRKDIGILHGAIRGVVRDITGLRETDAQARSELAAAVIERNRELDRVRLDIPALIRQECQRKNH